ncbi:hypothetical protein Loa_00822 [Legionella oakridgensis ATCC 33761 = DSM 21215]|uniref:Uncharacterized protein n=2 Tax=Legionella oakridgensis TaxID=29423 RepID=W0B968_9GAMM|nr:hypothetical protein Loa_00822 [Legionella oakridgensis ATCC 33761 = DSM 21215]ETO93828.1 hypothetical protein LOR_20c01730 [Legionella oakridgensis RV-2-2007]STY19571.1 Uncharacterised protein [Legionella longbeachae]
MLVSDHKNPNHADDYLSDVLFFVRYVPEALAGAVKHAAIGALLGWGTSYVCWSGLQAFAAEHHDAVDLTGNHVAEGEQFLRMSRQPQFNKVTPPISDILPVYTSGVGACAGFFYGLNKKCREYPERLRQERESREASLNPA